MAMPPSEIESFVQRHESWVKQVVAGALATTAAPLVEAHWSSVLFRERDFSAAVFSRCRFEDVAWENSVLHGAAFLACTFINCRFNDCGLQKTQWNRSNCDRLDLRRSDLCRADLTRTSLSEADLTGCNLSWSDLIATDLRNAVLDDVVLDHATLAQVKMYTERRNRIRSACKVQLTSIDMSENGDGAREVGIAALSDVGVVGEVSAR